LNIFEVEVGMKVVSSAPMMSAGKTNLFVEGMVWMWRQMDALLYRMVLIVLAALALMFIVYLKSRSSVALTGDLWLFVYTVGITAFQLTRLVSALLYERANRHLLKAPADGSAAERYEPAITFVIPCKNEEAAIARTVSKCFEAEYPPEKVEVVVINDGSTDGTLQVLLALKKKYPTLVVVDWSINRGKRHGMAEGIRRAHGEIIIQLDSDSYIAPDSVRRLIDPFRHAEVGAVCSHAAPVNAEKNWLTKMQAAYYFISFRILKAAESTFMTVLCCSGCCSAYRRSVIAPIMEPWLHEKFLGRPVTWGEDRALTNWVLRQGYRTIYAHNVPAFTICPDTLKKFLKQQIRWKKGWLVNSLFASRFILKREPFVAVTYFFPLFLISFITPFFAVRAFIVNPIFLGVFPVYYVMGVLVMSALMTIFYRWFSRENGYWPFVFVWSAINMIVLSFILFYAVATIQNRKWETR
jgi:hyaluronan synthase